MFTHEEKEKLLTQGYLHAPVVLAPEHLQTLQKEFDRIWEGEKPPVNQLKLLKHRLFLDLIEHPSILKRVEAIFGQQTQLLQFDLLRQGPASKQPDRTWHRDFVFPGDRPLSINTILYLDDITQEKGPTYVIPGSHRGEALPPAHPTNLLPLPDEIAVHASAGDAVFINSAIWHSGGCNKSNGLRRSIYLYYGYWWLKRYEFDHILPWQALEGASEKRLHLLGVKMPAAGLHTY